MSAISEFAAPAGAPAVRPTQPFFWSVRRELWENGSLFIAPLSAAALALLGFIVGAHALLKHYGVTALFQSPNAGAEMIAPYLIGALLVMAVSGITGLFYCLGALHNERRDRSILFWKSMPLSDLMTVLSKAVIPMLVLPLIVFVVILALHLVMLIVETVVFIAHGVSPAMFWGPLDILQWEVTLLYALAASALWYAPVYGWLFLVSGWARRVPFLWAILPPIGLVVFEKLAFNTNRLGILLDRRLLGALSAAFAEPRMGEHMGITPPAIDLGGFLGHPDVWIGLLVALIFGGAAVWLRRYREPI